MVHGSGFDGVPEFIIGGEMADGDRHYSILTKDGKEIKIDDTVANGQYFRDLWALIICLTEIYIQGRYHIFQVTIR